MFPKCSELVFGFFVCTNVLNQSFGLFHNSARTSNFSVCLVALYLEQVLLDAWCFGVE